MSIPPDSVWLSHSPEETEQLARTVAMEVTQLYKQELCIVFLDGALGSGKTWWSKAFATELGLTQALRSPSFPIVQEYPLPDRENARLVHADLWRIDQSEDVSGLGLQQLLLAPNVVVVEWAECGMSVLQRWLDRQKYVQYWLYFRFAQTLDEREVRVQKEEHI